MPENVKNAMLVCKMRLHMCEAQNCHICANLKSFFSKLIIGMDDLVRFAAIAAIFANSIDRNICSSRCHLFSASQFVFYQAKHSIFILWPR